jgi:hypothetical protein
MRCRHLDGQGGSTLMQNRRGQVMTPSCCTELQWLKHAVSQGHDSKQTPHCGEWKDSYVSKAKG